MKKKPSKFSRTFAATWHQVNPESGAIRSSVVSEKYWTTPATDILNFETFLISWILNYWQFYGLKRNLSVLAKGNYNNSERGVWIRNSKWLLVLHKRMQSMLSLLVKSNGFTAPFLSSTYLIHDIYEQLKKKERNVCRSKENKQKCWLQEAEKVFWVIYRFKI